MSNRLKEIDQDYNQQLSKVDNIRDITQKRLNIEQKERTLLSLKLEYLIMKIQKTGYAKEISIENSWEGHGQLDLGDEEDWVRDSKRSLHDKLVSSDKALKYVHNN